MLEQPQGRDYRSFARARCPGSAASPSSECFSCWPPFSSRAVASGSSADEESGRKILRFNAFERFTHWMTALSFIVLAISGLNYIFGKRLLMPLIGPDAFAAWSQYAKYAHNYLAWPFMLGVLFMLVVWISDNIPDRYDVGWLKAGGGFLSNAHPPARGSTPARR